MDNGRKKHVPRTKEWPDSDHSCSSEDMYSDTDVGNSYIGEDVEFVCINNQTIKSEVPASKLTSATPNMSDRELLETIISNQHILYDEIMKMKEIQCRSTINSGIATKVLTGLMDNDDLGLPVSSLTAFQSLEDSLKVTSKAAQLENVLSKTRTPKKPGEFVKHIMRKVLHNDFYANLVFMKKTKDTDVIFKDTKICAIIIDIILNKYSHSFISTDIIEEKIGQHIRSKRSKMMKRMDESVEIQDTFNGSTIKQEEQITETQQLIKNKYVTLPIYSLTEFLSFENSLKVVAKKIQFEKLLSKITAPEKPGEFIKYIMRKVFHKSFYDNLHFMKKSSSEGVILKDTRICEIITKVMLNKYSHMNISTLEIDKKLGQHIRSHRSRSK